MGELLVPMVFDYYTHPCRAIAGWMIWGDLTEYGAERGLIYAMLYPN